MLLNNSKRSFNVLISYKTFPHRYFNVFNGFMQYGAKREYFCTPKSHIYMPYLGYISGQRYISNITLNINSDSRVLKYVGTEKLSNSDSNYILCKVPGRAVIRISGSDTIRFIQNLITQDIQSIIKDQNPSVVPSFTFGNCDFQCLDTEANTTNESEIYTEYHESLPYNLLDPNGRILAEGLLMLKRENDQYTILMDTDEELVQRVINYMQKLRVSEHVDINHDNALSVLQIVPKNSFADIKKTHQESTTIQSNTIIENNTPIWLVAKDKRTWRIGYRVYANISTENIPTSIYALYTARLGIIEGYKWVGVAEKMPFIFNYDWLNYLCNYNKGCYIGQETITRAMNAQSNRRRVCIVVFDNQSLDTIKISLDMYKQDAIAMPICIEENSTEIAKTIYTCMEGGFGLALLRTRPPEGPIFTPKAYIEYIDSLQKYRIIAKAKDHTYQCRIVPVTFALDF